MRPDGVKLLTIAGFDPGGGAGLTRDLMLWNSLGEEGMAVCTANTIQTENHFYCMNAIDKSTICTQLDVLLTNYRFAAAKIGLLPHSDLLAVISSKLKSAGVQFVIWDPILHTTANKVPVYALEDFEKALNFIDIITPNNEEYDAMFVKRAVPFSGDIVIKSRRRTEGSITNILIRNGKQIDEYTQDLLASQYEKHGTGCVFSAALAYACVTIPEEKRLAFASNAVRSYMLSAEGRLGNTLGSKDDLASYL